MLGCRAVWAHHPPDMLHSVLGQPPNPGCAAALGLVLPGCGLPGPVGGESSSGCLYSSQATFILKLFAITQCYHLRALTCESCCFRRLGGRKVLTSSCTGPPGSACSFWKLSGSASLSFYLCQTAHSQSNVIAF